MSISTASASDRSVPGFAGTRLEPARGAAVRGGEACDVRVRTGRTGQADVPMRHVVVSVSARGAARAARMPGVRRRLRLTRRGRALLVLLPGAAVLTAVLLGFATQQATASVPVRTVTVPAGGSLWSIAERVAPGADPRDTVARIEQLNALPSSAVQAGQVLQVPGD